MRTTRSYRWALPFEVAERRDDRCSGTQFDPRIVEVVLAIVTPELDVPASPELLGALGFTSTEAVAPVFRR